MHAFAEKRIEASVRIFALAQLTQRDGSLGQALEDKEVEIPFSASSTAGSIRSPEKPAPAPILIFFICALLNEPSHSGMT